MFKFIGKRLIQSVLVIFVIITVTFFMVRFAPGDPFSAERKMPEFIKQRLMEHYGLNDPVMVQYANYLKQLVRGDLGPSFTETRSVNQILANSFPVSLELGGWALLIALGIGLPVGVVAAVFRNTMADYVPMSVAMIGICLPTFVLGPILAMVFGVWLGWFNVSGWFVTADRVLPAFTIGLVYAALIARITRGGMLEVLNQDFIRTALAKGVPFGRIVMVHTLKGGLLPVVSFLGPALAGIISGSFVVETIFQIPGMGREFVSSAFDRDYTLVLGTVILYAALITTANLLVDVVQVILNPRLRFEDS
ncbi:MAG: Oligopeptide transport system permease protein OppB [Verrucomicrobiota bacterium]|jgi:oligopeptide transport system permease protein